MLRHQDAFIQFAQAYRVIPLKPPRKSPKFYYFLNFYINMSKPSLQDLS